MIWIYIGISSFRNMNRQREQNLDVIEFENDYYKV
jgi:hypothetical protein